MAIRGQRFQLDLDSDDEPASGRQSKVSSPRNIDLGFVRDIAERSNDGSNKLPSPPKLKGSETGFPAHKKRSKPSAFKQQRSPGASINPGLAAPISTRSTGDGLASTTRHHHGPHTSSKSGQQGTSAQTEKEKIDEENKQRLAEMSPDEIERERQELMSGLSSSLIERLLKRANIDEGRTDTLDEPLQNQNEDPTPHTEKSANTRLQGRSKKVTFQTPEENGQKHPGEAHKPRFEEQNENQQQNPPEPLPDPDRPPTHPPSDLNPATSVTLPLPPSIHFPVPASPSLPLDPASPSFLTNLHKIYFPHLPTNPTTLAWLSPLPDPSSTSNTPTSPYSPHLRSFPPSSLRFDFRGRLLPPKLAAQLPVTMGLHHHGDAPEAAGYTIPELAHLSRSSVPGQRCVAFQTLGRLLYRLGRGDFGSDGGAGVGYEDDGGDDDEGAGGEEGGGRELYLGLWKCVEEGRVLETLMEEAGRAEGKGNRSCWVTATEALWLWRRGGGKRVRAG